MGRSVRIVTCAINGENPDYPVKEMIIPFFKKIIAKEGFHMVVPSKKVLTKAVVWADSVMIETPFPLSFRAAKIAKKMGKPVTGTFHIFPGNITKPLHINNRFWNSFFLCFFKNISFKNCDAIQCPTIKVKKYVEEHHFKQKLFVISNGITENFIVNPHKEEVGDPFTIICIGRFSKEKHQETLFKALELSKHSKKFKVIFAGKGPLKKKYEELANHLENKPILRFFSPDQLRKGLTRADLVVHCADVEVEGMAPIEAFAAAAVPVIADSVLSSTVAYALGEHNRYPFSDAKALADRLDYWYEHPDELKKWRSKYRHYAKSLSAKYSAKKAIKMLQDCIANKK